NRWGDDGWFKNPRETQGKPPDIAQSAGVCKHAPGGGSNTRGTAPDGRLRGGESSREWSEGGQGSVVGERAQAETAHNRKRPPLGQTFGLYLRTLFSRCKSLGDPSQARSSLICSPFRFSNCCKIRKNHL